MDKNPFLVIDMQNFQPGLVGELKRLTKPSLNMEEALSAAVELKFARGIKTLLREQLSTPDDEFVKFFFKKLCPENAFTGKLKDDFREYIPRYLKEFIREEIDKRLDQVSSRTIDKEPSGKIDDDGGDDRDDDLDPSSPIETTAEELEGYYIVKSILHDLVEPDRVRYKDWRAYFNILLDNNKKPLCRLRFNDPAHKQIGLFDRDGNYATEEKIRIDSLNDLYQYADRIQATAKLHLAACRRNTSGKTIGEEFSLP